MKKYVLFGCALLSSFFLTWVVCVKYLSSVLNVLAPHLSHDSYVNYWFAAFILCEIAVAIVIIWVAARKGVFSK